MASGIRQFRVRHHVSYSADQMFKLVADVESYPEFIPLCDSLSVLERDVDGCGHEILVCEMGVRYGSLSESFLSRVSLNRDERHIEVQNLSGPFSSLDNCWSFFPLEDGTCEVDFSIRYGFRSKIFEIFAGFFVDSTFEKFVDAFELRAREVYGGT